jgi:hypothetical protein
MSTRRWVGLCLSLGLLGCTSTESRCETICHFGQKCVTGSTATCSEAEIDECVDDYDDESDGCQDAFDEFADCIEEEETNCSDVENRCVGEATEVLEQCRFE